MGRIKNDCLGRGVGPLEMAWSESAPSTEKNIELFVFCWVVGLFYENLGDSCISLPTLNSGGFLPMSPRYFTPAWSLNISADWNVFFSRFESLFIRLFMNISIGCHLLIATGRSLRQSLFTRWRPAVTIRKATAVFLVQIWRTAIGYELLHKH